MTFSVLVPVQQSEMGEANLDVAAAFARQLQAKVRLLCVFAPVHAVPEHGVSANVSVGAQGVVYETIALPGYPPVREVETKGQAAERRAAECIDYLRPLSRRFAGLEVECLAREGDDAAKEIVDCAEEHQVDLIIMPTHGRSGLAHAVFGSVAELVVRASKVPVMVHRPT